MNKVNALFLHSCVEHMCPNRVLDETLSESDLQIHDKRVARLLVLLRQLDKSAEGLESLPEAERNEIISSAIRVCGFVDPIEARDVIAIVLDAIEMQDPIPKEAVSEGQRVALSDA
jgi:hypothetical protein